MAYITDTRTSGITLAQRFTTLRENFAAARAQRKVYTTTVNELNQLSNRELADLGVSRSRDQRHRNGSCIRQVIQEFDAHSSLFKSIKSGLTRPPPCNRVRSLERRRHPPPPRVSSPPNTSFGPATSSPVGPRKPQRNPHLLPEGSSREDAAHIFSSRDTCAAENSKRSCSPPPGHGRFFWPTGDGKLSTVRSMITTI